MFAAATSAITVTTGSPGYCYYSSNNPAAGHHQQQHQQQNHQPSDAGMHRTYYQSHVTTTPSQHRTMLSPDLAPDPQFVPFYDSETCKKEMIYQDLQPIPSQLGQLNFPYNNSSVIDLLQNHLNDNIPWSTSYSCQAKPPEQWSYNELLNWLFNWSEQTGVELSEINMPKYNHMNGQEFSRLTHSEFCTLDPKYGDMLYQSIQHEISQHYYNSSSVSLDFPNNFGPSNTLPAFKTLSPDIYSQIFSAGDSDFQGRSPSLSHDSDREDRESTSSSMSTANEKTVLPPAPFLSPAESTESSNDKTSGRRGRPPKGESRSSRNRQGKGNGKLWEFIRDLLLDPATNPSLIRWERPEEGIFKFVQSDRVAKMWGDRKQNPRMTYEKLSRAMRTYYSSGILSQVPKTEGLPKKLIYKFGPQSSGWQ